MDFFVSFRQKIENLGKVEQGVLLANVTLGKDDLAMI